MGFLPNQPPLRDCSCFDHMFIVSRSLIAFIPISFTPIALLTRHISFRIEGNCGLIIASFPALQPLFSKCLDLKLPSSTPTRAFQRLNGEKKSSTYQPYWWRSNSGAAHSQDHADGHGDIIKMTELAVQSEARETGDLERGKGS